jgi:hypothetical protein
MDRDPGWVTISNEFTSVRLRKRRTRNGERLEIISARLGHAIQLDPLELESLTWQEPRLFSRLLETPYGPEPDTEGRALSELLDHRPKSPNRRERA